MADPLFGADQLVADLQQSLRDTLENSLQTTPKLLRRTLETGAWRDFHTPLREHVTHERFEEFVTAEPFDGLGTTMDVLRGFVKADDGLRRILAEQVKPAASPGRPDKESATHNTSIGRDAASITARLKRDDPDLAARVVSGEITPNAAARQKGWRKPRIVVSSPQSVAASLRRHMSTDDLAELVALLLQEAREWPESAPSSRSSGATRPSPTSP